MTTFRWIFFMQNIGHWIYKSIVDDFWKLIVINAENIVHIIDFDIFNGRNDISDFIKNLRTFNIENSFFFYEDSFFHFFYKYFAPLELNKKCSQEDCINNLYFKVGF